MKPTFFVIKGDNVLDMVFDLEVDYVFIDMEVAFKDNIYKVFDIIIEEDSKRVIAKCVYLRKMLEDGKINEAESTNM